MIYYTIRAAQASKLLTRLIISTDDQEIADVAKTYGVEVPFMRPAEFAKDDTPDLPVFQQALHFLKENEGYVPDIVVHLRPTTPLKTTEDIDHGIQLLVDNPEAESVRSVCAPLHSPFKMYRLDEDSPYLKPLLRNEYSETFQKHPEAYNMPRQLLPQVWRHSGYVDAVRPAVILEKNSMSGTKILPLPFEAWRDVDIDSLREVRWAEETIERIHAEGREPWETKEMVG